MNTIVIIAHPDDEVIACGGWLHAIAGQSTVLSLTTGVGARGHPKDGRRVAEYQAAMKRLSVANFGYGTFDDQRLDAYPLLEVIQRIEQARQVQPAAPYRLITHNPHDLNQDHQITAHAAVIACRDASEVLFAEPIPHAFAGYSQPDYFVPLTEADIQAKLEALECYESELRPAPHPLSTSALLHRAAYWGNYIGAEYAEAFTLHRHVARVTQEI